jgi:hypothetical protein
VPFDIKHQASFTFLIDESGAFVSLSPAVYYVLGYQPSCWASPATIAARDSVGAPRPLSQISERQHSGRRDRSSCKDGRALSEISCQPVLERGVPRIPG